MDEKMTSKIETGQSKIETDTNIKLTIILDKQAGYLSIWLNDCLTMFSITKEHISICDTVVYLDELMLDIKFFTVAQIYYLISKVGIKE